VYEDFHQLGVRRVPDQARRAKLYELTVNSPAFVVTDKFIRCVICQNPSIGYDVMAHANGHGHQKKLCNYISTVESPIHNTIAADQLQHGALNLASALAAAAEMKKAKEERLVETQLGYKLKRKRDDDR